MNVKGQSLIIFFIFLFHCLAQRLSDIFPIFIFLAWLGRWEGYGYVWNVTFFPTKSIAFHFFPNDNGNNRISSSWEFQYSSTPSTSGSWRTLCGGVAQPLCHVLHTFDIVVALLNVKIQTFKRENVEKYENRIQLNKILVNCALGYKNTNVAYSIQQCQTI